MPTRCIYRVQWSSGDDVDLASHLEFNSRDECLNEADRLMESGIPYVWASELGTYRNKGFSKVEDWIFFWWSPKAVAGNAGPLPISGHGVPDEKSWQYHVPYDRLHPTLDSRPESKNENAKAGKSGRRNILPKAVAKSRSRKRKK